MRFRFVEKAVWEYIAAAKYYERQSPKLGESFIDEVERGIQIILAGPETWRFVKDDVRRYLIKRFPYGIYYTVEGEVVVIQAVKHLHRSDEDLQPRRAP